MHLEWNKGYSVWWICNEMELRFKPRHMFAAESRGYKVCDNMDESSSNWRCGGPNERDSTTTAGAWRTVSKKKSSKIKVSKSASYVKISNAYSSLPAFSVIITDPPTTTKTVSIPNQKVKATNSSKWHDDKETSSSSNFMGPIVKIFWWIDHHSHW